MRVNSFILICMFIIIVIIFYNIVRNKPLYEGLEPTPPVTPPVAAPTDPISNLANIYNNEKMTINNIDVTKNLNVAGDANIIGKVNIGGSTTVKDITANNITVNGINTPIGTLDLIRREELNGQDSVPDGQKDKYGCYYENIKFTNPLNNTTMSNYPDSYAKTTPERGYIQNAFCKRGYYTAGFRQTAVRADTTYRSYQLLCCPFIIPPK